MTDTLKRRLTTVLCADVHGYSRLMGADEAGTLERLRRYRTAMAGLIARHDGRIVNTWGDAVIAELPSVVEAVQCAIETQQELAAQDSHLAEAQRMRFRIGINLGDVMVDGTDIYGDGVNIAARLQELADPGGILISGPVYDQVHNKLSVGFDYLGRQQVKNVTTPVTSYRVTVDGMRQDGPRQDRAAIIDAPLPQAAADERFSRRGARSPTAWFATLPRPVAAFLVISAFLLLVNVFSGLDEVWFHWPMIAMPLVVGLWLVFRRKPAQERQTQRRTGGE